MSKMIRLERERERERGRGGEGDVFNCVTMYSSVTSTDEVM